VLEHLNLERQQLQHGDKCVCEIIESIIQKCRNGGSGLLIKARVLMPAFACGTIVTDWLNLWHSKELVKSIAKEKLMAIMVATGCKDLGNLFTGLIGCRAEVTVKRDDKYGYTIARYTTYRQQIENRRVEAISHGVVSGSIESQRSVKVMSESEYVEYLVRLLSNAGCEVFREVVGRYIFVPPQRASGSHPRIDLVALLGQHVIGIECKAPASNMGRAVSQALDYVLFSSFYIPGLDARPLDYCLIAPAQKPSGVVQSIMAQNRLGVITHRDGHHTATASTGGTVLFRIEDKKMTAINYPTIGTKNGSR